MKFAFAGTPGFSAWALRDLDGLGRRPSLVISQPDRAKGRGRRECPSEVAGEAARLGLECLRTDDISSEAIAARLRSDGITTLVVAAFGQILRKPLLEALLCLNIHASLLPSYRGAAPIERALAAGETRTGVSIMRMTEGLDQGPCALQTSVSVGLRDDAGAVGRELALLGAIGMDQIMRGLEEGTVTWAEQEGPISYANKLGPRDCVLDVTRGARAVHDRVRSLSPAIGARAACGALQVKVWRTWPYGQGGLDAVPAAAAKVAGLPGRLSTEGKRLFVGCGEGVVEVMEIQPAGKSRMAASAFLRGYVERLGDTLEPATDGNGSACADE